MKLKNHPPKYHQSISKMQQDYIDAWKTVINSAISLEQEYATKAGIKIDVPQTTLKTIHDIVEISTKAYANQNKITLDTAEATKQAFLFSIKTQNRLPH